MEEKRAYINLKNCGMKGTKVLMIAVVTVLLSVLVAGEVGAQPININSCTVISSPGEYILNLDITNSSDQVCIGITSSDVIFDGAGHIIDGIDGNDTFGIFVGNPTNPTEALTNVTVGNLGRVENRKINWGVKDWTYGLFHNTVMNGNIVNNFVSSNSIGVYLANSTNNSLTQNIAFSNFVGIAAVNSANNNLIQNIADANNSIDNSIGIYLNFSNNNNLINNEVLQNNLGIALENSNNNNNLTNNEVLQNNLGIALENSNNNNVRSNVVGYSADHSGGNNKYGIALSNSGGNNIYDNYFNNTINNTIFIEPILSNYWNTTNKREGYRIIRTPLPGPFGYEYYIIGDPYLGGNFWANQNNQNGTDFSQTCADEDKDGICDSLYKLNESNIDYLSLTPLKQFKVVDIPVDNSLYKGMQQEFKGVLEIFAEDLNSRYVYPYDVTVYIKECGQPNAYYSLQYKSLNLCYELPIQLLRDFSSITNESQRVSTAANTTAFILYHEAGHALINILDLPITGKEEDDADQIATYTFLKSNQGDAALSAAEWMHIQAQQTNINNNIFWDTHSFGEERFANIVCWVYGSNPQKYSYLLAEDSGLQDRYRSCPGEYEQMNNSLNRLLEPYVRAQNVTATPIISSTPTELGVSSGVEAQRLR